MMDVIIYHNNCPDGWCAAYICNKKYPEAELVPLNHGLNEEQLNEVFAKVFHKDVIMVDYSLRTRELNDQMANVTKSFRILDHHKTAQAALEGAEYATFDMKRSGAGLTWDYLFGKDSPELAEATDSVKSYRPWWVNYTEDQDLWNWKLSDSHQINAYLMVKPRTIEAWDLIVKHDTLETAAIGGMGVREYIEYYTRSVVAERQEGILRFQTGVLESEDGTLTLPISTDYRTAVLNIPYAGVSEAGNALVEMGYDIGLAWFERGDGVIQFSLRSKKGSEVDVSAIAKSFGGGGHQSAAGFQLSVANGRALVDSILKKAGSYESTSRCC
jgi:uncharacterized protein